MMNEKRQKNGKQQKMKQKNDIKKEKKMKTRRKLNKNELKSQAKIKENKDFVKIMFLFLRCLVQFQIAVS